MSQDRAKDQQARQDRADGKVADQEKVVARMNGSAKGHPEELRLLDEMRHNKIALDINRALLDYSEDE